MDCAGFTHRHMHKHTHSATITKKRRQKRRGKLEMMPMLHTKTKCWKLFAVSFRFLLGKGQLSFQFAFKAQRIFYSVCFISFWEKANVTQLSISRKWHCSVFSSSWWPPFQTFLCAESEAAPSRAASPLRLPHSTLVQELNLGSCLLLLNTLFCQMKQGACLHSCLWFSRRFYLAWLLTGLIIPLDI